MPPYFPVKTDENGLWGLLLRASLPDRLEIKYPHDIVGFDAASDEAAVRALVSRYDVWVSMNVRTHCDERCDSSGHDHAYGYTLEARF